MQKHKDTIIVVLLLVLIGLLVYDVTLRKSSAPTERDTQRLRSSLADGRKSGADTDPYEKNEVKNTILKNAADPIQACFNGWIKDHKEFVAGRVTLDWQILPDGTVDKPEIISSEIGDINGCIIDNIKALKFPAPPEGKPYYIVHKFFFRREEPDKEKK